MPNHELAEGLGNNLLSALGAQDIRALYPHMDPITAAQGAVLHEEGEFVNFAYFPCHESMATFSVFLADGRAVQTVLIGREGAVGGIVSHGNVPAYARSIVQITGDFLKIDTSEIGRARHKSPALDQTFALYADCLVADLFQSAACNAGHTIEARTAKWLLSVVDRTGRLEIPWTQEALASMLGVGRSYVTRVIRRLKTKGAVTTSRGAIHVKDLSVLDVEACGCHTAVKHHFDTILKGVYPCGELTAAG
jgi:hypothetical protein